MHYNRKQTRVLGRPLWIQGVERMAAKRPVDKRNVNFNGSGMKSLKEIKEEVAKEYKFTCWESIRFMDWDYQERLYDIATNRYAKEVAKEALKKSAENYTICFNGEEYFIKGIEDESNIPEL